MQRCDWWSGQPLTGVIVWIFIFLCMLLQLVAAGQQQTKVGGRGVHGTWDVLRVVLHSNVVRVICSIQSLQSSYHLYTCSIQSLQSSYHLYTCNIQSLQSSYHLSTKSLNSFYMMVRHSVPSRHISSARWYAIVYQNLNIHTGKKAFTWKPHKSDTNKTNEIVLCHVLFHYNMHAVTKFQRCTDFFT